MRKTRPQITDQQLVLLRRLHQGERALIDGNTILTEDNYRVTLKRVAQLNNLGAIKENEEGFIQITPTGKLLLHRHSLTPRTLENLPQYQQLSTHYRIQAMNRFEHELQRARDRKYRLNPHELLALAELIVRRITETADRCVSEERVDRLPRAFHRTTPEPERILKSNTTGHENQFRESARLRKNASKATHRS